MRLQLGNFGLGGGRFLYEVLLISDFKDVYSHPPDRR